MTGTTGKAASGDTAPPEREKNQNDKHDALKEAKRQACRFAENRKDRGMRDRRDAEIAAIKEFEARKGVKRVSDATARNGGQLTRPRPKTATMRRGLKRPG